MASSHLFLSNNMVLLLTDLRHMDLSAARASKLLGSMLHLIILCFRVSLNRFFCPPCDRFPCASSPYSSCLGILSSAIRTTRQTQRSFADIIIASMLEHLLRSRTSIFDILSCHFIFKTAQR